MTDLIAYDADLLVYRVGFGCQKDLDFGDGQVTPWADTDKAVQLLELEVAKVCQHLGPAEIVFCLSHERNFRKDVHPEYKGNRVGSRWRPLLFDFIREWVQGQDRFECWDNLEADDILGIMATRDDAIMVTIDKDLRGVPGRLCDPSKGWKVETIDEDDADWWHLFQTLCGDRVDNYEGAPGIGPKKASALLAGGIWEEVLEGFELAGMTEEDALIQARLARMLRDGDYNHSTGEVTLWTPR